MDKRDFSGAWDRCRAVLRLLRNCRPSSMRGIPQYKILVGTFHKSGTVLMQSIWAQACRSMGIAIWMMNRHSKPPNPNWQVAFHYDSEFGDLPLQHLHRGLIVIRDPRDLLISGMHYHRKSQELWLHQKSVNSVASRIRKRSTASKAMRTVCCSRWITQGGEPLRE